MSRARVQILRRREPLRLGFLPVSDCAPLVYASESGLFAKYDLEVQLSRESGWAGVRDKVIEGELDAAQAPATLPFLANLGVESDPCACISGLVLSLQGNAITVSSQLWNQGVRDAKSLRQKIYENWGKRTYTFGVVFSFSSQELLLRRWLSTAGIVPEVEVRIVAIPPAQMFPTLKLGYIDGFCVGEPWTSVAVQAGAGVCVATSADLAPLHPEKVLMVRQSFAVGRADEHERLIAALLEACAWCDQPEHRTALAELLANPAYVNAPVECLQAGFVGPFECGGRPLERPSDFTIFHNHNANEPSDDKAHWLMDALYSLLKVNVFRNRNLERTPVLKNVFRRDVFNQAKTLLEPAPASQNARAGQSANKVGPNGEANGNSIPRSSVPAGWWLALGEAALKPRG